MGVLSKLRGKQTTALATVQAPSADLIRDDNELWCPEPREIEPEMDSKKLTTYTQTTNFCYRLPEVAVSREKLLHRLKYENFRVYTKSEVDSFMKRYIEYAHRTLHLGDDLWWQWVDIKEYRHPLPYRVVKTVATMDRNLLFFVSDIVWVTYRYDGKVNTENRNNKLRVIPMKRGTEICFLKVAVSSDAPEEESLIIDAWRGPTFSDEEAKI
ncbi:MAG: hypothetical protein HYT62_01665 [Candidatus Yanofskybacteria bacterium]|nr:hypothetical protein [Candidatus Yanofskybacteria bacterium]